MPGNVIEIDIAEQLKEAHKRIDELMLMVQELTVDLADVKKGEKATYARNKALESMGARYRNDIVLLENQLKNAQAVIKSDNVKNVSIL